MPSAHIPLSVSAHSRPGPALCATENRDKPRVSPTTWAFSHLCQEQPISFSTTRLHHKSLSSKGLERPSFSPRVIFFQSRLVRPPFAAYSEPRVHCRHLVPSRLAGHRHLYKLCASNRAAPSPGVDRNRPEGYTEPSMTFDHLRQTGAGRCFCHLRERRESP